jgi:menaquinone-9 beta-reductase
LTLSATVTAFDATARLWDAVVIGAGPAGALLARQLAQAGRAVLLVEAKSFPRDKVCGGCLGQHALSVLTAAGLDALLAQLPSTPIREYEFHWHGRSLPLRREGGVSISRAALDTALVLAAVEAGAAFLPATTARIVPLSKSLRPQPETPTERETLLEQSGSPQGTVRSRVVIAADGLTRKSLRGLDDFPTVISPDAWVGVQGYLEDLDNQVPPGRVVMAAGRDGYAGLVRVEPDAHEAALIDCTGRLTSSQPTPRVNLAAALAPHTLGQGGGPALAVQTILKSAGIALPAGIDSVRWRGTGPLTHRSRCLAQDRVVLVGDVAGYIEPFTGEGMGHALASAYALAPLLLAHESLWSPDLPATWKSLHRRTVTQRQWVIRGLRGALHNPWLVSILFEMVSRFPALAAFVANRVHQPCSQVVSHTSLPSHSFPSGVAAS